MIIYEANNPLKSGSFKIRIGIKYRILYHTLRILASSLVTFSIVSLIFYYLPIVKEEVSYHNVKEENLSLGFGDLIQRMDAADAVGEGIDPYFSISIPKIDAKSNIIPNIDTSNQAEYLESLKKGVAHAKGTNFPGQGKLIYLFSHSTDSPFNFSRYNAVFYNLRKIENGDKIYVYYLNKKYVYQVTEKRIAEASDISLLNDDGTGEKLLLQTCDPPGTSIRRLIVIAVQI